MTMPQLDPRTKAAVTIAWVIIANKPFYPLYIWWLIGDGVGMSAVTLVAIPFFLVIPLVAGRSPFFPRFALPLFGTLDTVFETILFGKASGTLLFLAPCMALVLVSFHASEKWWQRGLACFIFACFAVCWKTIREPVFPWSSDQLTTLLNINPFAVASLMAFIAMCYAGTAADI